MFLMINKHRIKLIGKTLDDANKNPLIGNMKKNIILTLKSWIENQKLLDNNKDLNPANKVIKKNDDNNVIKIVFKIHDNGNIPVEMKYGYLIDILLMNIILN